MKTTLLLLCLFVGMISNNLLKTNEAVFENSKISKMKSEFEISTSPRPVLWKSELLAKADSSNQYIYIVGKHDLSTDSQLFSENYLNFNKCQIKYQNVDKNFNNCWTGNPIADYLDEKYLTINVFCKSETNNIV